MFAWLRRALTPAEPAPPRLSSRVTALENLLDDVDSRVEYLSAELKKVRGRQFASEKRSQDAPGETIEEEEPAPEQHPPVRSTAHLARRFRSF